jgi:hypothetical protein
VANGAFFCAEDRESRKNAASGEAQDSARAQHVRVCRWPRVCLVLEMLICARWLYFECLSGEDVPGWTEICTSSGINARSHAARIARFCWQGAVCMQHTVL